MNGNLTVTTQLALLYHCGRLRFPWLPLSLAEFHNELDRIFKRFSSVSKTNKIFWQDYLAQVRAVDLFLCLGCIRNDHRSWEMLFTLQIGGRDNFLIDILRRHARNRYPQNPERQENTVNEFWSLLLVSDNEKQLPILHRFDGCRPLGPWLIVVFRHWLHDNRLHYLDSTESPIPAAPHGPTEHLHDTFIRAANEWLTKLQPIDVVLYGLRWRYRYSQRELARCLRLGHEGTLSKRLSELSKNFLDYCSTFLDNAGWLGTDLDTFIQQELPGVLSDHPRFCLPNLIPLIREFLPDWQEPPA